ncbi:MAG: TIGR04086 family membrane protein [Clostridiales bacterium]|nr:TIGR04086 family membrane protein [Clostridiales bacterium]
MAQRKKEAALSPAAAGATVLTGGLLAFGVCLAVLAGAAGLMAVGKLSEGAMFRACCLGAALGGFAGGLYAALSCKSRLLPVALAAAGVSFLLWLLAGAAVYGSVSPGSAGALLAASLAGGGAAGVVTPRRKR